MEITITTIIDFFKSYVHTNKRNLIARSLIILFYATVGLIMTTRVGLKL